MTLEQLYKYVDDLMHKREREHQAPGIKYPAIKAEHWDHIMDLDMIVYHIGEMLGKENNVT
jgi:hypothetical protein